MRLKCLFLAAVSSLAACTHDVPLHGTDIPAGEVMANRQIATPTVLSFSEDFQNWTLSVGAYGNTFVLPLGQPLARSIHGIDNVAFRQIHDGPATERAPYNVRVDVDEAEGSLVLQQGFLTSKYIARVEIAAKIDVTGESGNEIARAIVTGHGTFSSPSTSPIETLQNAGEKAIKNLATDYVYKIVNTGALK